MDSARRIALALVGALVLLGIPAAVLADEADNVTCRAMALRDSQEALDGWVNGRIRAAVEQANRKGPGACDAACLARTLRREVGGSVVRPPTFIPHSRLGRWVERTPEVDRCHLRFRDSIYGARPYNQPWLFPFTRRVIFLADSIRLSGRIVGIDKINHFVREGLAHWHAIERKGEDVADVLSKELGASRPRLRMTEYGLKGRALTGVVAYADLAASYAGHLFWRDLLAVGEPGSYVVADAAGGYAVARGLSFAEYVTDAWDEGLNPSDFHPALGREVAGALEERMATLPVAECRALALLPDAKLYVNPACFDATGTHRSLPSSAAGGVSDRARD